jgi:hypothetical protein
VKINPPRRLSLDKYIPSISRNTNVQDVEDGMNIEYHVNPMEDDETNNIIELDGGKNRLIRDMFAPIDEGKNDNIYDVPLHEKEEQPFMKAQEQIFYFLYCYW